MQSLNQMQNKLTTNDWHAYTCTSSGRSPFFVDLALSIATNTTNLTYMMKSHSMQ